MNNRKKRRGFQNLCSFWPSSVDLFPKVRLWSVTSVWLMNTGVLLGLNLPLSIAAAPGSPIEAMYAQESHFHLSLENIFPLFFTRYTYTFQPHLLVHRKPLNPPKSIMKIAMLFNRAIEIFNLVLLFFFFFLQVVTDSEDSIA